MSALARTALRLAAVAALQADPVVAGLCGNRVFDSRIDNLDEAEPVPVIVVLTEDMEGTAWSANNGGPPFDDHCELLLEIAMRAVVQETTETAAIATPETDSELEAQLDLIEHCAVLAVTVADTAAAALVRQVARRVSKQRSARFVEAATGAKLAIRMVHLTAQLKGDDQALAAGIADAQATATPKTGNVGNGTVALAAPPTDAGVVAGNYVIAFSDAEHFTVTDPEGDAAGWVAGQPYALGVRFTINPGTTAFAAGDGFTLAVGFGPYAALPDPLRTVCAGLAPGSSGAAICALLAAAMPAPAVPQFFTGIDATLAPQGTLGDEPPLAPGQPGAGPTVTVPLNVQN